MGFASSSFGGGCGILGCSAVSSLLIIAILGSSFPILSHAQQTLFKRQSIATNESLVSAGGLFKLGFFRRGSSPRRYYLGIWYNISEQTVVWIANRERPLTDAAGGRLTITDNGTLAVVDGAGAAYWSSNSSIDWANTTATLNDNGTFVLRAGDGSQTVLWQSFDNPTDTFIPEMTITSDRATGQSQRFVSWRSRDDPAPGSYSLGLDPLGSGQLYMWNGTKVRWRSGQWNKVSFIGITRMRPLSLYGFSLDASDDGKMSLFFRPPNNTQLRFVMDWDGVERTYIWVQEMQVWSSIWYQPVTDCETYNFCGNYGICGNASDCSCLKGFEPTSQSEWNAGNWSGGCIRSTPLGCRQRNNTNSSSPSGGAGDAFARLDNVKLPDFSESLLTATDEAACATACSRNCSCTAYAYVTTTIGCMIWSRDLVDVAQFNGTNGNTLFLKLAGSEFTESVVTSDNKNKIWILWVVLPLVFIVAIVCVSLYLGWKYKAKIRGWWKNGEEAGDASVAGSRVAQQEFLGPRDPVVEDEQDEAKASDLPMYNFDTIAGATDNFSDSNKLGQGGFGHVYRGVLPGGEEIAVKRLSRSSGQGVDEFKNEVTLIAKLQHRNLVRLLGCCIQGEEKMLIYEYMPNKSLDSFLFNPARQPMLDWCKRFDIIEGIARGLLYLHRDSRLRVVHRDLKASNILLDEEMNPKISDFGMARIFGGNQNHDSTNRVVGTFGYMSPEYAMEGLFSVKSDVYSFGVLMLEIVSGRKNSRTRSDNYTNLLGYVWQLWTADRTEEIIDPCIRGSCPTQLVLRCIHIGLLCVQDRAYDRPNMSSVVIMLGSEAPIHQMPKQPTFAAEGSPSETDSQKPEGDGFSVNDVTITILTGR